MIVDPALLTELARSAIRAGDIVSQIYRSDFDVHLKGDASPVTAADEQAEASILSDLARLLPGVPVVAEEAAAAGRAPEQLASAFLLVDPLDGTREFVSRNGEFTVNIALVVDGRPVAGVVHAPVLGEIHVGVVGEGARRGRIDGGGAISWAPIAVRAMPPKGATVLASRSHCGEQTEDLIARLGTVERIAAGSSLKFCRLAEGVADLYPRLGRTMEWDTAAGHAVLAAAGGGVIRLDGEPFLYGKRGQAGDCDFANPWFLAFGDGRAGEAACRAALECGFIEVGSRVPK